jgi:SAM-dependent methyltransferase
VSGYGRAGWDERHRGREAGGTPEPFLMEILPLLPCQGIALDVAAGRGRHSIAMAQHGLAVIAVDYSQEAMRSLESAVHERRLAIWPVIADLDNFSVRSESLDLIVNINYLDRRLFPEFERTLKPGGMLMVDTFLIDQLAVGHPSNPKFMFEHHELKNLLAGYEIRRYSEGVRNYPDGSIAWRASALAIKKEAN